AVVARIEVTETLSRELPQPFRLPRGLHGDDRPAHCRRDQAGLAAHRRLLVSARRHSDRCVLADRSRAKGSLAFRPGGDGLSRTRVKTDPRLACRQRDRALAVGIVCGPNDRRGSRLMMKRSRLLCALAFILLVPLFSHPTEVSAATDPASLGFSAARLARIGA